MIVGVDVSSRRVDLAWLENGKPQRWHQELGDPKKAPLIDRLREIRVEWPAAFDWSTTEIAIEYPFARGNAIPALWSTMGVITRQAPPWARVAWPRTGDLRNAIGADDNKTSAHLAIWTLHPDTDYWDEHELDALVACIGWGRILAAQDAA